jgi:nicotinamidase-related amidase
VAPQQGEITVRKIRVGAFSTTDLHAQLQRRSVDTLFLAGVSTSNVVLSTVRAALDLDYRVIVVSDACADRDSELHELLITHLYPKQTDVIESGDLAGLLQ